MKSLFKFFYFNKFERKALFIFLIIIILIKLGSAHFKQTSQVETYNFEAYDKWWKDSVASLPVNSKVPSSSKIKKPVAKIKTEKTLLLNLNQVDSIALMSLPGIGQVYSSRIVRYRELLGGFVNEEQLLEVYGIDSILLVTIDEFIFIDESLVRRVPLNSADVQTLASHPYISYKLASIMVKYRNHHGPYTDMNDLKGIPLIDEQLFRKIAFYLDLE